MRPTLKRLKHFADRAWYAPLLGVLAALDQFIVIIPLEWLLIPHVMVKPQRWLRSALWVTTGCAVGAVGLACLANAYGMPLLEHWAPHVLHGKNWARSMEFIDDKGAWALFLIAVSPFPQQPAVALSGLSHMPWIQILIAVWLGRALKYCTVAYLASHAPKLLAKIFPHQSQLIHPTPSKEPQEHEHR